mgnify:CR=1 FL=1
MPIELKTVTYTYMPQTPFERTALDKVSLTIEEGSFTAIAGHTGSGKSTLVQHLNGILHPSSGQVLVDGVDLAGKGKEVLAARRKVGMVFQYPEHQLFEETVALDVAFGPKNMELPAAEIEKRVRQAMEFVNLDYDTYKDRSPFQLSGGQMRRAAIAGVVALQPKYLVLDEPTAGLDPRGREDLLQRIVQLHKKEKITIVFVSHNMDDIARVADRVVFMDQGMVLLDEAPAKAFFAEKEIAQAGLAAPQMVTLLMKLQAKGLAVDPAAFTMEDGVAHIMKALKGAEPC